MALISCPECGAQISDKARMCPKCGCPAELFQKPQLLKCEECGNEIPINASECPNCGCPVNIQNHQWVDLGLPSGTLWATCNIGANSPEEMGDKFAWGETTPKELYNIMNYRYCKRDERCLTKYCTRKRYGYDRFADDLTRLHKIDDAATKNWGDDWRMPTSDEFDELAENCKSVWSKINGVEGYKMIGDNGNSIFLPSSDSYFYLGPDDVDDDDYYDSTGMYWTSDLEQDDPDSAWAEFFNSDYPMDVDDLIDYPRCMGLPVRPVRTNKK